MKNPFTEGYVLFHFPGTSLFKTFHDEIRSEEPEVGICLVDPDLEELPQSLAHLPKVHFIRGSGTNPDTYEQARLKESKAIIVFPPSSAQSDADAATKTVVHLIAASIKGYKTRIMHILREPKNAWMFVEEPSVTIFESLNVLSVVQECSDPHSSTVVESMLRNTEGASLTTVTPEKIVGMNWRTFTMGLLAISEAQELQTNPVALIREGRAITCPKPNEVILPSDLLCILAFPGLNWRSLETDLLKQNGLGE